MSVELLFYLIFGLVSVKLEHETFAFDFKDLSRRESIIAVLQQSVHYIRIMLVWPLYVVEDWLIYFDNKGMEE
jgi:hypothetical protein